MAVFRIHFPLEKLPYERWTGFQSHHIADEHLAESCREAWNEIANLIGVWKDDVGRLELPNQLLKGEHIAVGSVVRE